MLILTKLLSVILAIIVITKSYHDYKKKNESLITFLSWTVAWIFIAYVSLRPVLFYNIMTRMSDENIGIGTLTGTAFVFLFFITYRIYIKANRLELQIRNIVMKIGLKDINEK